MRSAPSTILVTILVALSPVLDLLESSPCNPARRQGLLQTSESLAPRVLSRQRAGPAAAALCGASGAAAFPEAAACPGGHRFRGFGEPPRLVSTNTPPKSQASAPPAWARLLGPARRTMASEDTGRAGRWAAARKGFAFRVAFR